MRIDSIRHQVVELAPKPIEPGVLYVSLKYKTAVHLCCCGCGEKVITPLSAAGWQVSVSNSRITLYPSIGNWAMNCRSHYWIRNGRVCWAGSFTAAQIQSVHKRDKAAIDAQFERNPDQEQGGGRTPRSVKSFMSWFLGK